jgi:hypothetical protein
MNFLKYIELSAENLQFFLWYRDYSKRFDQLPASERALSPEWISEKAAGDAKPKAALKKADHEVAAVLEGTDFAKSDAEKSNPFFTPPVTPTTDTHRSYEESIATTTGKVNHAERASAAFESAGLKWKPCK